MQTRKAWLVSGGLGVAVILSLFTGCESSSWGRRNDERTSGQAVNDSRITSQVKEKLADEPVYKFNDVDVKTFAGVVQLSGFVNTDQQRGRAGELAQQVPGVTNVVNSLTIKPQLPAPTGRPNQAPIETYNQPGTATNRPAPVTR